jgi:hypothetical protein
MGTLRGERSRRPIGVLRAECFDVCVSCCFHSIVLFVSLILRAERNMNSHCEKRTRAESELRACMQMRGEKSKRMVGVSSCQSS